MTLISDNTQGKEKYLDSNMMQKGNATVLSTEPRKGHFLSIFTCIRKEIKTRESEKKLHQENQIKKEIKTRKPERKLKQERK